MSVMEKSEETTASSAREYLTFRLDQEEWLYAVLCGT